MHNRKLAAGLGGLALVAIGGTLAISASGATSDTAVIKQTTSIKMKPNRYIQDGLRFNKDVYTVNSGGTLKVVLTVADEGPHTITVVKKGDLPKTGRDVVQCKVCEKLGKAHGFPRGEGPPKFFYLENGKGQKKPPNYDRPGDSGIPGTEKGDSFKAKVTAKPGTTLDFMCLIHPWMQAKIAVK